MGVAQFAAVRERAIGGSGGLLRIAAMPERQGQISKRANPEVLPVAKGVIAVLVGPIQRHGRFEMREGCTVVAAPHQRQSDDAMADQERAGGRLRLGDRQEVGGVLERGRNTPAGEGRDPKPPKNGEMDRGPDCPGLGHKPVCSLQRGDDFRVGVAFSGHQRCAQGDVDIELQLLAIASFG